MVVPSTTVRPCGTIHFYSEILYHSLWIELFLFLGQGVIARAYHLCVVDRVYLDPHSLYNVLDEVSSSALLRKTKQVEVEICQLQKDQKEKKK